MFYKLACLICLSLIGCQSNMTPLQKVDFTRGLYVSTIQILTPLIDAGLIAKTQGEKDAIWNASEKVKSALDQAEALILAGNTLNYQYWITQATSALDILLQYKIKGQRLERAVHLPTTQAVKFRSLEGVSRVLWRARTFAA